MAQYVAFFCLMWIDKEMHPSLGFEAIVKLLNSRAFNEDIAQAKSKIFSNTFSDESFMWKQIALWSQKLVLNIPNAGLSSHNKAQIKCITIFMCTPIYELIQPDIINKLNEIAFK